MVKFKIIISDPVEGKAKNMEVEGVNAQPLIGRTINETVDGSLLGLRGKRLRITGGVDRDGFPLRPDVHGGGKKKLILTGGVGFKARRKGERKRKTVRGSIITEDTYVINMTLLKEDQTKPEGSKVEAEGGEA